MLRLLKFLWVGDWHLCKWETINKYQVYGSNNVRPERIQYHCKCSICGKHKKFD